MGRSMGSCMLMGSIRGDLGGHVECQDVVKK